MKKSKLMQSLLTLLVSAPIWYYLLYQVLDRVNASDIMWFLYWIYLPAGIFAGLLGAIAEAE